MSRFYGRIGGSARTYATRRGNARSGLRAEVGSRLGGIGVVAREDLLTGEEWLYLPEDVDSVDRFDIALIDDWREQGADRRLDNSDIGSGRPLLTVERLRNGDGRLEWRAVYADTLCEHGHRLGEDGVRRPA